MKKRSIIALLLALCASCTACGAKPEATDTAPKSEPTAATETTTSAPTAATETTTSAPTTAALALTPYDEQWRHAKGKTQNRDGFPEHMAFESCGYTFPYEIIDGKAYIHETDWAIEPDVLPDVLFMPETIDGYPVVQCLLRRVAAKRLRLPDSAVHCAIDLASVEVLEVGAAMEEINAGRAAIGYYLVDPTNPYYCAIDGVLFSKDKTILCDYPGDRGLTRYTVPSSTIEIADGAFDMVNTSDFEDSGRAPLKDILIPPSVTVFPEDWPGGVGRYNYDITILVAPGSAGEAYFSALAPDEDTGWPPVKYALREFAD